MNMSTTQTSQSLIESMSYVVIAVDNDGIITLWNKAAELTLGFEASEALGQHANMVIPVSMQ
jgi:PAS domain S-box-containing protein